MLQPSPLPGMLGSAAAASALVTNNDNARRPAAARLPPLARHWRRSSRGTASPEASETAASEVSGCDLVESSASFVEVLLLIEAAAAAVPMVTGRHVLRVSQPPTREKDGTFREKACECQGAGVADKRGEARRGEE